MMGGWGPPIIGGWGPNPAGGPPCDIGGIPGRVRGAPDPSPGLKPGLGGCCPPAIACGGMPDIEDVGIPDIEDGGMPGIDDGGMPGIDD